MNNRIPICPVSESLLAGLAERKLVVRATGHQEMLQAVDLWGRLELDIACFIVQSPIPLAAIPFDETWRHTPLAIHAPTAGNLRDLLVRTELLRDLDLRVFLPADSRENIMALRILSSLGIDTGVSFEGGPPRWEELTDLAVHALLARGPHASIEPFEYLAANYEVCGRTDMARVYFDDPQKYLHLDAAGRVALTRKDLLAGSFVADSLQSLGDIEQTEPYRERMEAWREVFLDPAGCASCEVWRICLGRFEQDCDLEADDCRGFFREVMSVVEQKRNQVVRERHVWQP